MLLVSALAALLAAPAPAHPPHWPASFSANITEVRTAKGSGNTTGYWAYDAMAKGMRVDRDDGEYEETSLLLTRSSRRQKPAPPL